MDEFKPPYISEELIDYLELLYQDKAPEPSQTEREIWMNRGAVGVARHLRMVYNELTQNSLGEM
jgi:hypothetical protein